MGTTMLEEQEDARLKWIKEREEEEKNRKAYWRNMGLSNRSCNSLFNAEIFTLEQLKEVNYVDLLHLPNFGVKSLREMREKTGFPLEPEDVPDDLPFTDLRLILELRKRGYNVYKNNKVVTPE